LLQLNSSKIYDCYWKRNLSLSETAKEFNVAKRTVAKFMISNNIPRRNRIPALIYSQCKRRKQLKFKPENTNLGYVYGVMKGDGSLEKRSVSLAVKDKDFILRFKNKFEKLGFKKFYIKKRKDNLLLIKIHSINLVEFLETFDFDRLSRKQKIEFINGFYDSEGNVFCKKYKCYRGVYRRISCYNKNKNVLIKIQIFLNGLGIKSYLSSRFMKGGHSVRPKYRKSYMLYQLAIYNKNSLKIFARKFKLFGRKQKAMEGLNDSIR
jgi:hypothetical protein